MKIKYVAEDGTQFNTELECFEYERQLREKSYRITFHFTGVYTTYAYNKSSRKQAIKFARNRMNREDIEWTFDNNNIEIEVLNH
jgi:hypothetical protein